MKQVRCFLTVLATTFLMSSVVSAQVTAVTVTEDGNVGIGTTTPLVKLHLNGRFILDNVTDSNKMWQILAEGDRLVFDE